LVFYANQSEWPVGLTELSGVMSRTVVFLIVAHVMTAAFAVGWAYTSHEYDCLNIGPCVGDLGYWIKLGDIALVSFFASWATLLFATLVHSVRGACVVPGVLAWVAAFLLPPTVLFSANWLFNLGVSVAPV
jgi:hypothetical protein